MTLCFLEYIDILKYRYPCLCKIMNYFNFFPAEQDQALPENNEMAVVWLDFYQASRCRNAVPD